MERLDSIAFSPSLGVYFEMVWEGDQLPWKTPVECIYAASEMRRGGSLTRDEKVWSS